MQEKEAKVCDNAGRTAHPALEEESKIMDLGTIDFQQEYAAMFGTGLKVCCSPKAGY